MSNIVKHRINSNIFFAFFASLLLSTSSFVFAQDAQPTPLQLKQMQTRKFMKNVDDVAKGIKSNCEDAGSTQAVITAPMYEKGRVLPNTGMGKCYFTPKPMGVSLLSFIPIVGDIKTLSDLSDREKAISQMSFDLDSKQGSNETVVRMRIFTGVSGETQIYDEEIYKDKFKKLGDSLYIEALPINASVQQ